MPLPPLVEPAADLTAAEAARYSRHLSLPGFGEEAQRRLKNARVLVIGAGGLGSPALLYLAAAGVGTLGIVDPDTVEESNLQRQIVHGQADIGRPKVLSAADAIAALNPLVRVEPHQVRLAAGSAADLFAGYDLILDGTDNFAARYLVNDAAAVAGKPYVWGSIDQFAGQVSVFWEQAPDGRGVNYRDLYPQAPPPGSVTSCADGGVLGVLCAAIGAVMGTEAIKLLTGIGEPLLGRLLIYDAMAMSHTTIDVRKDPQAPAITALPGDGALSAGEVRELLDAGAVTLIDVREPAEWQVSRVDGAVLFPASAIHAGELPQLPAGRIPVLYCRTGARSAAALAVLKRAGVHGVRQLRGGIVAWAAEFDPDMDVY